MRAAPALAERPFTTRSAAVSASCSSCASRLSVARPVPASRCCATCELVREQALAGRRGRLVFAMVEGDVPADREGPRAQGAGGLGGGAVAVHAHVGEIDVETRLHRLAHRSRQFVARLANQPVGRLLPARGPAVHCAARPRRRLACDRAHGSCRGLATGRSRTRPCTMAPDSADHSWCPLRERRSLWAVFMISGAPCPHRAEIPCPLHADVVGSCADSWREQACHGLAERLAVGAGVAIGGQRDAVGPQPRRRRQARQSGGRARAASRCASASCSAASHRGRRDRCRATPAGRCAARCGSWLRPWPAWRRPCPGLAGAVTVAERVRVVP